MLNKNLIPILITFALLIPNAAFALEMPGTLQMQDSTGLQMPSSPNALAQMSGISATAYVVADADTGNIIISSNADATWTPASLTKLVTAMVVLDNKVPLTRAVTMTTADQIAGACSDGGACIKSKAGVKFTVDGLFHAALIPSANNAANALARSTGLSTADFVTEMNSKVAALGGTNTHFNEPTGMDPTNQITASDYVKIVTAAFSNPYLRGIAGLSSYTLHSINNSRYNQTIKNTDKLLLADSNVTVLGAKTGYLNESMYNFAALLEDQTGEKLAVVVLGEQHLYTAFNETAELANLAMQSEMLALSTTPTEGLVLGTSTTATIN